MTFGTEDRYMLSEHLENIRRAVVPSSDPQAHRFVDRFGRNGVEMVRGNGKGIPLLSAEEFAAAKSSGKAWKIAGTLVVPPNLVLSPDRQVPGGLLLGPERDMTMARYSALLTQVALSAESVH
jgi:hypothetical protein